MRYARFFGRFVTFLLEKLTKKGEKFTFYLEKSIGTWLSKCTQRGAASSDRNHFCAEFDSDADI